MTIYVKHTQDYTDSVMYSDVPYAGSGDSATDHDGLTQLYQTTWTGPYLRCFGTYPLFSGRMLEAWIDNPKGILPATIVDKEDAKLIAQLGDEDPWIRRVICRVQMVGIRRHRLRYLVKVYAPIPRDNITDADESLADEDSTQTDKPFLEALNIRPDLDACPVVDGQGLPIRSHARGLVTKELLQRIDGVEGLADHKQGNSFMQTAMNLCVSLSPAWDFNHKLFFPRKLTGINADCMDALLNTLFRGASQFDHQLRAIYTPAVFMARPLIKSPRQRKRRVRFASQVQLIPSDEELAATKHDAKFPYAIQDTQQNSKPPRENKIRKILTRLFSCLPVRRRKVD